MKIPFIAMVKVSVRLITNCKLTTVEKLTASWPCGKNRVGSLKLVNAGIYLYIQVNFTICASEEGVLGIKKYNKLSFHGQFKELALFKVSPLFRVVLYLGSSPKNILNPW